MLARNPRDAWPPRNVSRRQALKTASAGFGYLALAGILGEHAPSLRAAVSTGGSAIAGPLAPKPPHFAAKAKRVIFVFMQGAISQMDTWEYKPKLQASDGQVGPGGGTLVASKFKFAQHGQTGTWVSELYPHLAKHVDDLCFLRGLHTDTPAHPEAVMQLHTGTAIVSLTRPSVEFSIGTTPNSAWPRSTSSNTAAIVPTGKSSALSPKRSIAARWLNVNSGPR